MNKTVTAEQRYNAWVIREVYPITKIIKYGNNCYETVRTLKAEMGDNKKPRGNIRMLSKKSLLRLMFVMQCTEIKFKSILTLTYPKHFPHNGEIVKSDINVMAQRFRRMNWSYVWFLEFQKRGAPHIHWLLPNAEITIHQRISIGLGWTNRIASRDWYKSQCPPEDYATEVRKMNLFNCHEKTWELIRGENGARNYASKYASKERQKKVPSQYKNVGRFWGSTRDVRPVGVHLDVTEEEIEEWLKEHDHPAAAYELVPRYLWGVGRMRDNGHATNIRGTGD